MSPDAFQIAWLREEFNNLIDGDDERLRVTGSKGRQVLDGLEEQLEAERKAFALVVQMGGVVSDSKPHSVPWLVDTIREGILPRFHGVDYVSSDFLPDEKRAALEALQDLVEQLEAAQKDAERGSTYREMLRSTQEQLEASQRSIVTIGNAFIDWYQAEVFNSEAEAREEWQRIAVAGVSNPASRSDDE